MRSVLRILGVLLLLAALGLAATAVAARFHDGPIAVFAGGPFRSGEWAELSWHDASFLADRDEIEWQLLEPARSRVTWVLVHERVAYVPCGMPDFRLWKQWPHEAVADGRAVVRIDGRLHRRRLVKVDDPALEAVLRTELGRKYGVDYTGEVWFFRMDPRGREDAARRGQPTARTLSPSTSSSSSRSASGTFTDGVT
jgi:hypothetical protein